MATPPRIAMQEEVFQKQEIDTILLEEVTWPGFYDIRGFTAYTKIGITGRGTAILT
jgi:hypothetical protein